MKIEESVIEQIENSDILLRPQSKNAPHRFKVEKCGM